MSYLYDQAVLLLYCLCSLFFLPLEAGFVIALLFAAAVCTFLYVYPYRSMGLLCACACAAMLAGLPWFGFFAPFFTYAFRIPFPLKESEFARQTASLPRKVPSSRNVSFALYFCLAAALCLRLYALSDARITAYVLGGVFLALLLFEKTDSYMALTANCRRIHDNNTEKELLLKEQNQSLMERQNYEIYTATLKERNRIAREIHDNVGHMLTRSILMVGALKAVNQNEALHTPIEQLDETLNSAMNTIRESVHGLHEQSIDLESSLKTLIADFPFCPVTLQYDMSAEIPIEVKYCMIAVAKEALVNISRHSSATAAWITAREHPAFYQFSIRDNGTQVQLRDRSVSAYAQGSPFLLRNNPASAQSNSAQSSFAQNNFAQNGFAQSSFAQNGFVQSSSMQSTPAQGIGLNNMLSRVSALRGSMQILTEKGFCIYITLPK